MKTGDKLTVAIGVGIGIIIGLFAGVTRQKSLDRTSALDDIILTDALSGEPAKTLVNKGYVSKAQLEAAAAKGVQTMVDSAHAAFSSADIAKEQARAAVDAYLADKTKTPVIKVPAAPAP